MLAPKDFFDLNSYAYRGIFDNCDLVWEPLRELKGFIKENIEPNVDVTLKDGEILSKTVVIHDGKLYAEGFKIRSGSPVKGDFSVTVDGRTLNGATVLYAGSCIFDDQVSVGSGCVVEPGALIKGPTIIGNGSEIRQGAYIRARV